MHLVSAPVLEEWAGLSDERVVARVIAGQTALFEVLMRRHNERVYRAVRAIVKREGEVEDVMQHTYVIAYSHLRQFDVRSRFSTWLMGIAVHAALARTRRQGRNFHMDVDNNSTLQFPTQRAAGRSSERLACSHDLAALMETAIDQLPDGSREVFILRQVEGMDAADVAEVLGVSEAVVKTRFSRARAMLRRELYDRAHAAASHAFQFVRPRCDRVVAAVLARIL
jgi:RNA polymerase sigma-70 factor (ECF subfamily)